MENPQCILQAFAANQPHTSRVANFSIAHGVDLLDMGNREMSYFRSRDAHVILDGFSDASAWSQSQQRRNLCVSVVCADFLPS